VSNDDGNKRRERPKNTKKNIDTVNHNIGWKCGFLLSNGIRKFSRNGIGLGFFAEFFTKSTEIEDRKRWRLKYFEECK
jgi:hypothetical protein